VQGPETLLVCTPLQERDCKAPAVIRSEVTRMNLRVKKLSYLHPVLHTARGLAIAVSLVGNWKSGFREGLLGTSLVAVAGDGYV